MLELTPLNIRSISWTKLTKLCLGGCSERTKGQRPVSNMININNETPNYLKKQKRVNPRLMSRHLFGPNLPDIPKSECNQRPLTNIRVTGLRHGYGGHRVTPKKPVRCPGTYLTKVTGIPPIPQRYGPNYPYANIYIL